jgi:hypothetical protein
MARNCRTQAFRVVSEIPVWAPASRGVAARSAARGTRVVVSMTLSNPVLIMGGFGQWLACFHRRLRQRQQSGWGFNGFPAAAQIMPLSAFLLPLAGNPMVPSTFKNITSGHPVIRAMAPLPIPRRPHEAFARLDLLYAWWRWRQTGSHRHLGARNNWRCHCADREAECQRKTCTIRFHMDHSS